MVVWGARAERIAAQLRKGTLVYVDGQIRSGKPTDDNPRPEIHVQRLIPLGSLAQREAADSGVEVAGDQVGNGDEAPF